MSYDFAAVTGYPAAADGPRLLQRLLEGIGHRFYYATDGLGDADLDHSQIAGHMTIRELLLHIDDLMQVSGEVWGRAATPRAGGEPAAELRQRILTAAADGATACAAMPGDGLVGTTIREQPFWHAINGPLADVLTHIGQINLLRRLASNPAPPHKRFSMQGG